MNFEQTLIDIKKSLFQILGSEYREFTQESEKDIENFIKQCSEKLERWTKLLSNGEINLEEYEWLVKSQKDLMLLSELEKAGFSKIRLGHLKGKMVKAIVGIGKGFLLNLK